MCVCVCICIYYKNNIYIYVCVRVCIYIYYVLYYFSYFMYYFCLCLHLIMAGRITYNGLGSFTLTERKQPVQTRQASKLGLICGGTGITPMLQVLTTLTLKLDFIICRKFSCIF